jgi:NADH:ubiquinone oxidoreductase subunit 5 (subunit L)/multisubunit Na+/H+ antiporter MnhA subunit
MEKQNKIQILLATAEERNKAIHIMRERVQKTCIGIMGIFYVIAGWFIKDGIALTTTQKEFLIGAIVIAALSTHFLYLRNIFQGFQGQQRVLARIEDALKLYDPGVYDNKDLGLFPDSWKKAGTDNGKGKIFLTNYLLLYIGAIVLIISIWICPISPDDSSLSAKGFTNRVNAPTDKKI